MNKPLTVLGMSVVVSLGIILFGSSVFAQLQSVDTAASKVVYPIAELGNCTDKGNCASYCEQVANMQACINFAKKNAMLNAGDIEKSERVIKRIVEGKTPGQCKTRGECEQFCKGNVKNMKACVSFAEEMNILPPAELAQAKKVAQALEGGAKLPGTCTDKQSCDDYCSNVDHLDECLIFAEKADIIPANDIAEARKVASFLKAGTTPGACKTKQSCESYCKSDQHFDECIGFAEKAGLVSKEDIEMAKKTGGKGPGGCKSKEECSVYCEDQAHIDECVQFGMDKGVLTPKQIDDIQTGIDRVKKGLASIDPEARNEIEACVAAKAGAGTLQKLLAREMKPTQKMGESIQACFQNTMEKYAEKMKARMMKEGGAKGYEGGSIPTGMMPQGIPEGMMQNIPESMRQQIPEGMQPQIPGGGSTGAVSPQMMQGGAIPAVSCDMFKQVPSCDMIPDPRGVEACKQCKQ